ncbi:hypothetical protein PG2093B_0059 [Bifidobacterium pseudolongum subsp. globosum]|uniref:DUF805 domain-containing protein n=1 Tax=Bifidobacterium pseudolongum subsp. globosum TaxID=1690 RepID=A0A4Q5A2L7_9BIFI|nr:DUF805 domain-containing protein [Bifidobacterium pseudolongum]RYQ12483.1 hypothetical protein PG2093B_0059 [Bifidobacterium pseudolongum subsp. globosum]
MTDPFTTPDPQAPQEPTPVYDSANPAGNAPQAPQPNEPAPVLYGESVTFTETSTPAPNPYEQPPAYGAPAFGAPAPAPADPSATPYGTPAYSAPVDPNAAAFNAPAPAAPAYTAPTYPAPAPVDPTTATYGTPTYEAPAVPPASAAAPTYGAPVANVPPAPAAPAASYTTSTGLPYAGVPSYDQMPPAATPGYAPAQPGMPVGAPYGSTAAEPPINMPWYGIDFVNAIKRFFTKYATFSGRASRGEFWWVMLFLFLVSFVFNLLSRASSFFNVLSAIWGLAILVPQIALAVRRVHDANLPGGWVALPYGIEVLGALVMTFSTIGAVTSGLSGSSGGFGGSMAGMLIGVLIMLAGAVTAIVLFAKQSDPQGARFDARQ